MSETPSPEISIFLAAIEKQSEQELAKFLEKACGSDQQLRARVEALVGAHRRDSSFLERPARELDRTVDLDQDAMNAGLESAFQAGTAVGVGGGGYSVLESLGKHLPEVPRVALHDSQDEGQGIVRPRSKELPSQPDHSRYQLLGEIARGGMGAIVKGRDTDLGRDLAIKVLLDSHKDRPEIIQRFIEEAQIGGQLQHPGIVPVYELGEFRDERPFFSMKLVKGKTLASLLSQRSDPTDDLPKFLGIFEQICQTMAYAHSKGVIHRDLKPANIMVGAFGEVQVMDWGLSKVLREGGVADEQKSLDKHRDATVVQTRRSLGSDSGDDVGSQTQMGSVMGTPAYMPPEQALGEVDRLDERADVFGLGAILAEILTGLPPYVAEDSTEVFRMASRAKLDDCLSRLDRCGAEPEVVELVKRSLAPQLADRLPDASALSGQITEHLEGVQERLKQAELDRVEAQARSEEERRRKRLYVAIAGLLVIVASGGAISAAVFAKQQTELANEQSRRVLAETTRADEQARNAAEQARNAAEQAKLRNIADAQRLVAESEKVREEFPVRSTLLALEAVNATLEEDGTILPTALDAVLNSSVDLNGPPLKGGGYSAAISPNGRWLVSGRKTLCVSDLSATDQPELREREFEWSRFFGFTTFRFIDDDTVIAGRKDGIRLFDLTVSNLAATGDLQGSPNQDLTGWDISADRKWLATSHQDQKVRMWDLQAREFQTPRRTLEGSVTACNRLFFSPDGRWLAGAESTGSTPRELEGQDNRLTLWDLNGESAMPAAVLRENAPPGYGPRSVSFSPDGRWMAASGKWARVWDLNAERNIDTPIILRGDESQGYDGYAYKVAISGDGQWLATSGSHVTVRQLSATGLSKAPTILLDSVLGRTAIAASPNGRWLTVTSEGRRLAYLWDLQAEWLKGSQVTLRGHRDLVREPSFSDDSSTLITTSTDGTVRRWHLSSRAPLSDRVIHLDADVESVAFNENSSGVAVGTVNGIYVWGFEAGGVKGQPAVLDGGEPRFSTQGRWLLAKSKNQANELRVWDLNAADIQNSLREIGGNSEPIDSYSIGPNDRWLVSIGDRTTRLWDLASPTPGESARTLDVCPVELHGPSVMISPDGKWIVGEYSKAQVLHIWDFQDAIAHSGSSSLAPRHTVSLSTAWINGCAFTPNSRYLVGATMNAGQAALIDLTSENADNALRLMDSGKALKPARQVLVSPDSTSAYTYGKSGKLIHWDFSDPDDPLYSERGVVNVFGGDMAVDAAFERLVSSADDGVARVWELANMEAPPRVLRHPPGVRSFDVSSDGRWVITGAGRTMRIWDLNVDAALQRARSIVGRQLTDEERSQHVTPNATPTSIR